MALNQELLNDAVVDSWVISFSIDDIYSVRNILRYQKNQEIIVLSYHCSTAVQYWWLFFGAEYLAICCCVLPCGHSPVSNPAHCTHSCTSLLYPFLYLLLTSSGHKEKTDNNQHGSEFVSLLNPPWKVSCLSWLVCLACEAWRFWEAEKGEKFNEREGDPEPSVIQDGVESCTNLENHQNLSRIAIHAHFNTHSFNTSHQPNLKQWNP